MKIIPAIIPKDLNDLEEKVSLVKDYVSMVQVDICDGKFVQSRSWPYYFARRSSSDRVSPKALAAEQGGSNGRYSDDFKDILSEEKGLPFWERVDYEIDLFVSDPAKSAEDWILAGASSLIFHVESSNDMQQIFGSFRARFPKGENSLLSVKLGISLNVKTPTDEILPYLEDADFVQFMGIEKVGFQGQVMDQNIFDKIREFHNSHPEIEIAIDGGVNLENVDGLKEAGVSRFVSGSVIFESDNILETIQQFKDSL